MAVVSKESVPLDKAATKNLDALKAYALGARAYESFHESEALGFFQQAVALDPSFALAHTAVARSYLVAEKLPEAVHELQTALGLGDRLLPRERLLIEATLASIAASPRAALDKWKIFVEMYPDNFTGQGNYPYFAWILANRYDADMIKAAQASASPRNPHPLTADLLLAALYLGNERYDDAIRHYRLVEGTPNSNRTVDLAAAYASQRRMDKASEALALAKSTGALDDDISAYSIQAAIAADRDDWDDVWKILSTANKQAIEINDARQVEFREIELSLRQVSGNGAASKEMRQFGDFALSKLSKTTPFGRAQLQIYLLFAAYLSAAQGDIGYATDLIGALGPEPGSGDYPVLSKLLAIAQAEIARQSGKPGDSIKLLEPLLDGSELAQTHVALLEAYASSGDNASALQQAHWIASHRGRAYVEQAVNSGIPFNVVQTNIALLRAAELNLALGEKAQARRELAEFRRVWPHADDVPSIAERLRTATTRLAD
jgi:tetratricopeptide (TPR) repeat protein